MMRFRFICGQFLFLFTSSFAVVAGAAAAAGLAYLAWIREPTAFIILAVIVYALPWLFLAVLDRVGGES